jgi:hypothetical protein
MKFGFLTIAASALLAGPVLGKPSKGLRKNTKVRADLRISPMNFSVFWLTELLPSFIQTGRTQPCCSSASQTL